MWKLENKVTGEIDTWYEAELINDIREAVQRVLRANHCNNCDGIGLDECGDMECGVKAAQMIEEMIQENEK